uniref:Uncharacterized protein n=1 Tax=Triticum urartu TaxID=4572 RepID=A0A8R7K4N6_TRIUA
MPTPTLAASSRRQIRCTSGSKSMVGLGATVRMFKAVVAKTCKVSLPQHRLIHNTQILKNEKILARHPHNLEELCFKNRNIYGVLLSKIREQVEQWPTLH